MALRPKPLKEETLPMGNKNESLQTKRLRSKRKTEDSPAAINYFCAHA